MMFQAYQHYFNQKETGNPDAQVPSIRIQGNQARRGYRPLTTAGSSQGYRTGQTTDHTRQNSKNGIVGLHKGANSTTSQQALMINNNCKCSTLTNTFAAGSNSNLFVFKNGWSSGTQAVQKNRPQSSNQNAYKRKPLAPASAQRIWKYNPTPSMSATGFARTSSAHKLQQTQQHFLTNSIKSGGGDLMSQRMQTDSNAHQPRLIDNSIKGVLSGSSNLINLT